MKTILLKSEKATLKFAERLAKKLKGGEIFALSGDLGSGKTVFAKGIAKGLGLTAHITSPTFVLMKIYKVKGHKTIKELCHVDCYRLDDGELLKDIGIEEYLANPRAVCVIEWAERLGFLKKYKVRKARFALGKKEGWRNVRIF